MKCGDELPPQGVKSDPITLYMRLKNVYPCVPQEVILRQYSKAFKVDELTPETLMEAVFPTAMPTDLPDTSCALSGILTTLTKSSAFRRPPVPRDHTIEARLYNHDFPVSRISALQVIRDASTPKGEEHEILVGYESGAVVVYVLKRYGRYLETARYHTAQSKTFGIPNDGKKVPLARSSELPDGIDLMGYHSSGRVMCCMYDSQRAVALSGSVDGSIYVWDIRNLYEKFRDESSAGYDREGAPKLAIDQFADAVRTRRLQSVVRNAHSGPISAMAYFPDTIITGGAEGVVKVWGYSRKTLQLSQRVRLCLKQSFDMNGWVRSIYAAPARGVQLEDILMADDTGWIMGLKEGSCPTHERVRGNRSTALPSVSAQEQCGRFNITRVHQTISEEKSRLNGICMTQEVGDATSTIVDLTPIRSNSLLVCLNYSPIVQVFEQSTMRVATKLVHPLLTGEANGLMMKEATAIYRKEALQRELVFLEKKPVLPSNDSLSPGTSVNKRLLSIHDNPLRFISTLYVTSRDILLLLDNQNTIFVWEFASGSFVAKVSIPPTVGGTKVVARRAISLLPYGTEHYTEGRQSRNYRSSRGGNLEEALAFIPFFILCDTGVELYNIVKAAKPVLEVSAHKEPVIGLAYTPYTGPTPLHCISCEREVRLISASVDGKLFCWADQLMFLRGYAIQRPADTNVSPTTHWESDNEVSSLFYHPQWELVVTGHNNGGLRYWSIAGELLDIVFQECFHTNTVSCIRSFLMPAHRSTAKSKTEVLLVTVSYDGTIAKRGHPMSPLAHRLLSERVSYNELLSIAVVEQKNAFLVGDSGGQIIFISCFDFAPLRSYLVQGPQCNMSTRGARKSPHVGAVVTVCVFGKTLISCDDEGKIVQWDQSMNPIGNFSLNNDALDTVSSKTMYQEITCAGIVGQEAFLVCTRTGHIHYFKPSQSSAAVSVYVHISEVVSVAIDTATLQNTFFEFAVGDAGGLITSLSSSIFTLV